MLSLAGCLVADPPLYEEPPPTPPVFDLTRASPIPGQVVVINRTGSDATDSFTVTVPFRSDDNGEPIFAGLHLDYFSERADFAQAQRRFPASTFDDTSRQIVLTWDFENGPDPSPGCHTVTLLACHENNWDEGQFRPHIVNALDDTATATWWLNVDPPEDDPYTLRNCPAPGSSGEPQ